jgi:3-oxoacyl-[acyl-carrier protein] reductase
VRYLSSRGARVACVDRNHERGRAVVAELDGRQDSAVAISADVTDEESIARAFDETRQRWGYIHGVVNCVGITGETGLRTHEVDIADFDRVVAVNLRGALIITQQIVPIFLRQRYGRLLHVASIAGKEGNAGMVAYSASKAGLIGLVKSVGKEYARDGITVNALAPAVIWTDLVERMPTQQVEYMTSRIPMGRLGTLEEAAQLIAWIISPAASFTTGFTFDLSGGRATY